MKIRYLGIAIYSLRNDIPIYSFFVIMEIEYSCRNILRNKITLGINYDIASELQRQAMKKENVVYNVRLQKK